ncbi:hypothetical protein [Streptomyces sp. NPDC007172]|uniref:hypothetical protein n=1 Tax=Streptomyces sp. NPDC007172 TaxID=3364776 RepID=UPI0036B87491
MPNPAPQRARADLSPSIRCRASGGAYAESEADTARPGVRREPRPRLTVARARSSGAPPITSASGAQAARSARTVSGVSSGDGAREISYPGTSSAVRAARSSAVAARVPTGSAGPSGGPAQAAASSAVTVSTAARAAAFGRMIQTLLTPVGAHTRLTGVRPDGTSCRGLSR